MIFDLFGSSKRRNRELLSAARSGDSQEIEQLIAKGADLNCRDEVSGDTPLLAALDKEKWQAAETLLEMQPDLGLQDVNGNTPLFLLASKGDAHLPLLQQLISAGAPIGKGPLSGGNAGATPLHTACAVGANKCVSLLLKHGADTRAAMESGTEPIHSAAIGGTGKTVDLLISAGADADATNAEGCTPIHYCAISGNASVARTLIRHGARLELLDRDGYTPLGRALIRNNGQIAKVLLEGGADPNIGIRTPDSELHPLQLTVINGHLPLVKLLIESGSDPAVLGTQMPSLITMAEHKGHHAITRYLRSRGLVDNPGSEAEKRGRQASASSDSKSASMIRFIVTPDGRLLNRHSSLFFC
jgi:ankyrin repeat protein